MNSTAEGPELTTPQHPGSGEPERSRPPLRRPAAGRIVAGVAAAIGGYCGIDVTIVRVVFALLAIIGFTGAGFGGIPLYLGGIPLYLAGWLLIPEEGSDRCIAASILHGMQDRTR